MEIKESDLLELGFTRLVLGISKLGDYYREVGAELNHYKLKTVVISCYKGEFKIILEDEEKFSDVVIPIYPRTLDELKTIIRVFSEARNV